MLFSHPLQLLKVIDLRFEDARGVRFKSLGVSSGTLIPQESRTQYTPIN
jgi:hypothetical protein